MLAVSTGSMQNARRDPPLHDMKGAREINPEAVRPLLVAGQQRRPLARRQAGETLREVFRLGRDHVLKRYTLPLGIRRFRRPWVREHDALTRLDGWHAPRSVGYVEDQDDTHRVIRHVREYVSARPVVTIDETTLNEIAMLLAGYHRRGVITDDALLQNFMHTRDGRMIFIDMGRARIFGRGSPLLPLGIALELTKFRRASLNADRSLFRSFLEAYFAASDLRPAGRIVVRSLVALLIWQRRVRGR